MIDREPHPVAEIEQMLCWAEGIGACITCGAPGPIYGCLSCALGELDEGRWYIFRDPPQPAAHAATLRRNLLKHLHRLELESKTTRLVPETEDVPHVVRNR